MWLNVEMVVEMGKEKNACGLQTSDQWRFVWPKSSGRVVNHFPDRVSLEFRARGSELAGTIAGKWQPVQRQKYRGSRSGKIERLNGLGR